MTYRSQQSAKLAFLAASLMLLVGTAVGQLTMGAPDMPVEGDGKEAGPYKVTQSVDLGGRITSVKGSEAMYNTLVDLQSGPRILEQSLTMQSINHHDAFDTFTLNSFGWGGDPEQALRLRINKYRWYTINGSYQHFQNYWNYDLFANPLNPPNVSPYLPVLDSAHSYYNRQNMYYIGISLLPLRRISLRFDYNRNRFIGPAYSSDHQGTEASLYENTNSTQNGLRFGADFRATKKTTISYTQMIQWYSGQTGYNLAPYNVFNLSNGTPVSFGLPWLNGGSPCNAPLNNGVANPVCNGFFNYSDTQNVQTFIPTEQINLKSTQFKNLDINAQYQYSGASMNTPNTEIFDGLITRSAVRGFTSAGSSSHANWVSSSADASATYRINEKLRLVDTFHWRNWRSYGNYSNLQTNFFSPASLGSASLIKPVGIFPATILGHTSSSPADVINEYWVNLDGQDTKQNDFQVQYDFNRNFGVRAGFQWTGENIQPGNTFQGALGDLYFPNNAHRGNCIGVPLNPDGSCTFVGVLAPWGNPTVAINNYAWLIGAWYHKGGLNAHADATFGSANNYAYRIDPRTGQNITGSVTYAPKQWLSAGANLVFQRATNYSDGSQINFNEHNYHSVFNATFTPNKYWALDVAYSFDAIQQDIVECFAGSYPVGSPACFDGSGLLQTSAFYNAHTQYGFFTLLLKPSSKLAFRAGYTIVNNTGDTTQYNIYQPLGPLASRYQLPLAGLEYNFYRNMSFRGGWNYQNYNENSYVGPTAPRNFHANETTLAIRYAF